MMQTRLSVNLNKVALIRNSRGGNNPDLIKVATDCEAFGAEGITIHPRPDQRHARYSDIQALKAVVKTELNVEGYPTPELLDLVLE
ncbi:MAG TPA: pyridoxine 5'-phosphate synthase, partial [Saprospiraceae bacterium]|nr:pyridoxine 5'-phosphate synthase [Saprospiraceae bacterium]